ncbi:hypothetical protein PhaeoP24_01237 [Phaeobacter inhibens]|nr:hypothetical protein PhaeoP51_01156 [Phaeobacter inhibens]AUQ89864.1 hypothetical protein PhaeoP24_01237 [Phaeobacter inhibens]
MHPNVKFDLLARSGTIQRRSGQHQRLNWLPCLPILSREQVGPALRARHSYVLGGDVHHWFDVLATGRIAFQKFTHGLPRYLQGHIYIYINMCKYVYFN